jgi:hypothetical protein
MQQKERNFEHVDKNKKQEGFSNGFLQDIVISFILARRDTTYARCSQHQFSPCFVSFKFCLKDLLIGLQHLLSFVLEAYHGSFGCYHATFTLKTQYMLKSQTH